VVAAAGEPGFAEFAAEFEAGVEGNSLEFFVQHASYEDFECGSSGGFPAPPRNCLGHPSGTLMPAIPYGIWNSEGGYFSPEQFAEFIVDRIGGKDAPDAYVYAIGHNVRGEDESSEGVDLVVAGVRSGPPGSEQRPGAAIVFRVTPVHGVWSIVGVKIAAEELVDSFFDWWAAWDEVDL
jgi:hypothetical protein